jgi:lysophospholipase L1-like esterase
VAPGLGSLRTSCARVIHVGDSTSVGLTSTSYLPKAADRVDAQYKRVGVAQFISEISGARSIVETHQGKPNAETAVARRIDAGYDGCWVVAMGTNDPANQFVGGTVPLDQRIDLIMRRLNGQPAMWLSVKSLKTSGPYADQEMQKWTAALEQACARYPNLRVYDWAGQVQDTWFVKDGIHFTTPGYQQRARRTADALAIAFPRGGQSPPECFVAPAG